jgi:hypothetical protein
MRALAKRKSVVVLLALLAVGIVAWALMRPEPAPPPRKSGESMSAIVYHEYGTADVLRLEQVDKLLPEDHQVLLEVRAAAANPLDWHRPIRTSARTSPASSSPWGAT